jgi:hypothetical protein
MKIISRVKGGSVESVVADNVSAIYANAIIEFLRNNYPVMEFSLISSISGKDIEKTYWK